MVQKNQTQTNPIPSSKFIPWNPRETFRNIRKKIAMRKVSITFVSICSQMFFSISCASLLPPERRVYPNNPVKLPEGMDIHTWMDGKINQFPKRLWTRGMSDSEYKFTYFRKEHTSFGSYIACTAIVKAVEKRKLEIYNMVSTVNYADYTKGYMRKGGDLGPMNEMERSEILIPCMEEFLSGSEVKERKDL